MIRGASLWLFLVLAGLPAQAASDGKPAAGPNGFSLAPVSVDVADIVSGGPPRDGIKSVDEPSFVDPKEADWSTDETPVIGLRVGAEARAYPVHLLEYHQIVNDRVGGVALAVTYDPLTGTPLAYRREIEGRTLHFGVSGLIYRSSFLLYDRETESLWSQFLGRAISGPLTGTQLVRVVVRQEPLAAWVEREPGTRVLERPNPTGIDYRHSPFSAYWTSVEIPFPVPHRDERFHPKELVVGVEVKGLERAYLGSRLSAAGGRIVDRLLGLDFRLAYDPETGTFRWDAADGLQVTETYWFAWKAFHPDTEIWSTEGSAR